MHARWFMGLSRPSWLLSPFRCRRGRRPLDAWWDGKWKYRKKIVLDTTPQGADIKEALADFPVLVRLHSGNFTFENAKTDGSDIRSRLR